MTLEEQLLSRVLALGLPKQTRQTLGGVPRLLSCRTHALAPPGGRISGGRILGGRIGGGRIGGGAVLRGEAGERAAGEG